MWFREQGHVFDWGSLKWCQSYASPPNGCFDVETIALDEFGHVESLDHHVNYADERDYDDAVVQTVSRAKPQAGWNTHGFGTCDSRHAPARVRRAERDHEVLDLPGSLDDADAGRIADVGGVRGHDHADRDPQGRRRRRLRPAAGQSGLGSTVTPPAAHGRDDHLDRRGHDGRRQFRHVQPGRQAPVIDRVPGRLRTPSGEGLNGDTSPTVAVAVAGCSTPPCPLIAPAAAGVTRPVP